MKRTLIAAVLALSLFTSIGITSSQVADAKRPPRATAVATIEINQQNVALGDWVTFTTTGVNSSSPRIQIMCYQGTTLVYGEAGPAGQAFLLGGGMSQWLMGGGEADCEATVYEWDWHPQQTFVPFATTTFHAGGR